MITKLKLNYTLTNPMEALQTRTCLELIHFHLKVLLGIKLEITSIKVKADKLSANFNSGTSLKDAMNLLKGSLDAAKKKEPPTKEQKKLMMGEAMKDTNAKLLQKVQELESQCDKFRATNLDLIKQIGEARKEISSLSEQLLLVTEEKEKREKELLTAKNRIGTLLVYKTLAPERAEAQIEIKSLEDRIKVLLEKLVAEAEEKAKLLIEFNVLQKEFITSQKESSAANLTLSNKNEELTRLNYSYDKIIRNFLETITSVIVRNKIEGIVKLYKEEHKKLDIKTPDKCTFRDYKNREVSYEEAGVGITLEHMNNCMLINSTFKENAIALKYKYKDLSQNLHDFYGKRIVVSSPKDKQNLEKLFEFAKVHEFLLKEDPDNFEVKLFEDPMELVKFI